MFLIIIIIANIYRLISIVCRNTQYYLRLIHIRAIICAGVGRINRIILISYLVQVLLFY